MINFGNFISDHWSRQSTNTCAKLAMIISLFARLRANARGAISPRTARFPPRSLRCYCDSASLQISTSRAGESTASSPPPAPCTANAHANANAWSDMDVRATRALRSYLLDQPLVTSASNAKLKLARALRTRQQRKKEGLVRLDGHRLVLDALGKGLQPITCC